MNKKNLIVIIIFLIPIYLISFLTKTNFIMASEEEIPKIDPIYVNYNNTSLELDDYVYHVVAAEMPATFLEEALKAQILATRTFTYNKIYNDSNYIFDSDDQAFNTDEELQIKWAANYNKYKEKIEKLIKDTHDEIITFAGIPIKAYYFSMSNGYTSDAISVFGIDEEYLKSVKSENEDNIPNFQVTNHYSQKEIANKLDLTVPIKVNKIDRDSSNRVIDITINNKEYKGTEIRSLLNLRSTDFKIDITNNDVLITTTGYGHGVGMSQYGANIMAQNGSTYKEIIKKYYTNTEIKKINE